MRYIRFVILISVTLIASCRPDHDNKSIFPLEHYSQTISDWITPTNPDYDKVLLNSDLQQKKLDAFYNHIYGSHSPWDMNYINQILIKKKPDDIKSLEQDLADVYNNHDKSENEIGYGENFHPYTDEWLQTIKENIDFSQLDSLQFNPSNLAIAVDNLHARALPTDDVYFFHYKRAGQGYPFDNLQMSSLWVGTPVYILAQTRDHAWTMVITTDYIGWVHSNGIARVDSAFVNTWKAAAKKQLAAITRTRTSMSDIQGNFRFLAYIGTVLPVQSHTTDFTVMLPVADDHHHAIIKYATVSHQDAVTIPLSATQHHFADIMGSLIGRPYGWGNMYFYNDCSAELKNLFTPFGIWLPRHSSDQVTTGRLVDMTSSSPEQRLTYLMENGHRFMTLVYLGGHIILYIGNYPNPNDNQHALMAMTYQNMWGLSPHPATRRAIIGKAVLLPMLLKFPEDSHLMTQAAKPYFQISYLDEIPGALNKLEIIDLRSLMYP